MQVLNVVQVSERIYVLLHWSAHKVRIPNASIHNVFLTCSYSVLLFCFPLGKKDKFRRNNRCVKSCYTCQETFTNMIWRRQQYTIHFTGMCSMTISIFCQIYLFICNDSQRFLSLWMHMCGISLWWIMFTLQFMTNISLVIFHTTKDPSLTVLNSHVEVQWYATNVHPMSTATTFLCVISSYNFINSLCTDNIFVSNYCFAFVSFVYFLNIYTLIQVTSSQETISSYYHASK